jgi:hypothetical protein
MPNDLRQINGVEIFAAGKWNGDTYTVADLDEMVRAFSETGVTFRPALKLGHDDNQTLLQRDGHPAAGWIGKLYRVGEKLIADFIDIPSKIYELLERGAYKKVSAEVYWNATVGESKYSRLLGAVALLGADLPAVTTLSDIFKMYALNTGELKTYETNGFKIIEGDKVMPEKTEQELKLEAELAEAKKNHSTLEQSVADKDKEIEELKKFKAEAEAKFAEEQVKREEAELEASVTDLEKEKLVTPAMRPYVKEFLGAEKKEYSFGETKLSKHGLLKEILKLHTAASEVNVTESSEDGKVTEARDDKALNEKIEAYAKEHKLSYKAAYKAVMAKPAKPEEAQA